MAPDEEDRLPIEQPEQEDPEAKRAEMAAEHSEVIDELSVEPPEIADHPAMSPVADVAAIPAETLDKSVGEPQRKRGRYYVKPQERTPQNRADRRAAAEHDRVMRQMSQPGPAPVADNLQDYFAKLNDEGLLDESGSPKHSLTESEAVAPQSSFFDADLQNRQAMADAWREHARRIEELTLNMEMERL